MVYDSFTGKEKTKEPTLVITYSALQYILAGENAVIAPEDVSSFMRVFALYAAKNRNCNLKAADEWKKLAETAMAEEEEDEDG